MLHASTLLEAMTVNVMLGSVEMGSTVQVSRIE